MYFFVIVLQNKYNFYFEVTIELFYTHFIYFKAYNCNFSVFHLKFYLNDRHFNSTFFNFLYLSFNMASGHTQLPAYQFVSKSVKWQKIRTQEVQNYP